MWARRNEQLSIIQNFIIAKKTVSSLFIFFFILSDSRIHKLQFNFVPYIIINLLYKKIVI